METGITIQKLDEIAKRNKQNKQKLKKDKTKTNEEYRKSKHTE